uniref:Polysaccharide deacetylase family protein n=1 Tax=candidate division WOR-3 bacterium TaxID=2052148 RepID=A0A7C4YQK5_UNCW3
MRSILNYHKVSRSVSPFFSCITPENFETQLRFFKLYYEIIEFEEYLKGKNGVVITFDDGFKNIMDFLPQLIEKYNFKPIVFVVTGYLGKNSGWDVWINREEHLNKYEIKKLSSAGVIFGSHTHNHPPLTMIEKDKVHYELEYSKKFLEDLIGKEVKYISYPFGRTNKFVTEKAMEIGYKNGFLSIPKKFNNDFNIGRWSVYSFDNLFIIKKKTEDGGFLSKIEMLKCSAINRFSFISYYARFNNSF